MKKQRSKLTKLSASLMCTALLFGCTTDVSETDNNSTTETDDVAEVNTAKKLSTIGDKEIIEVINGTVTYDNDDNYSDWTSGNTTSIELTGTGIIAEDSGGAIVDENIISIKTSGIYVISGKLNDGQIIIDAEDKGTVRLVLNDAEINSSTSAPIYVQKAEKTIITLAEGTENYISDGTTYTTNGSEDEPNAAIYSKDDLTINGSGKLVVIGNYNNGIVGRDDLKITGGTIEIEAVDDGLMGRDLLAVKDGNITIEAGGDAIKSTNDQDETKGVIAIEGGTFNLTSTKDGIQAETSLWIADGVFSITSGGGSPETISSKEQGGPWGSTSNTTTTTTEDTASGKGLKAGTEIAIGGGTFDINAIDDAIHSNNSVTITGGKIDIATGDDGIHGDLSLLANGGDITISKSYEGMESEVITIASGNIHVNAVDDGLNVGGGNDSSNPDMQSSPSESLLLTIAGGNLYVNAQGDGLDSNGSMMMTGGTAIVNGPTGAGNGALDYNQTFEMDGGLLIATGSAGMSQAPSDSSEQYSLLMTYPQIQSAGSIIHLEDNEGNIVATFAPEKEYQTVVISSPALKEGATYTLYSSGTASGSETNGLYTEGNYSGGTKVVEFSLSALVTWLNEFGVTTPQSGGFGGNHGGMGTKPNGTGRAPSDIFSSLDEETRAKVEEILEKQRTGTITTEEAQSQLNDLGVDFPIGKLR